MVKSAFTIGLLALLLAVPVYGASVNKSINVDPGTESSGESTVNGSISVGEGATVTGRLSTVNGRIRIGDDARVEDVHTVNGSLSIGSGATTGNLDTTNGSISVGETSEVDGSIDATNGRIALEKGSEVTGDIRNVNGEFRLEGSVVEGNLSTVNGGVSLNDAAVLKGDLVVKKPGMFSSSSRLPEIVIGPGSTVGGVIRVERQAKLYVSETAKVGGVEGVMSMRDAVRFSGERP